MPSVSPIRLPRAELVETHISWVFLTIDRAYKVKKPVVFPFVDYRDPVRRRELCEEEVRLNRRLAPDLYLGVRGLVRNGAEWRLTDPDDPAATEWAVEMRRFDERCTLAALVEAGTARPDQVAAVGELIAGFHRGAAERSPVDAAAGVARKIEENFDTLAETGPIAPRELAAARRFSSAFLAAREGHIQARAAAGLVRDCHGDLRAEHVVFGENIEIFDCVEFDPALREIDVGADLAFLVMDLTHSGRDDLVAELVRAYRSAGGDPGDDALLAFFATYRAWVRAKVAALRAGELEPGPGPRAAAVEDARALAATARRFAWRARGPELLVVCGGSATGKTHLARRLAAIAGWAHLGSDVVRKALLGLDPTRRAPPEAYSAAMSESTYEELGRLARAELAAGMGVIVDATFRFGRDREAFARGLGAPAPGALFLQCRAPAAELARRAAERERDAGRVSDADPAQVELQRQQFDPLDEVPPHDHVALRTDRPVEEIVDDVEDALDARLATPEPDAPPGGALVRTAQPRAGRPAAGRPGRA